MKIGVDARLLSYRRGIGNYLYSVLSNIAALDTPHEFTLFVGANAGCIADLLSRRPGWRVVRLASDNYVLGEQVSLARSIRKHELDLLHCPANSFPLLLPDGLPLVVTVHDVMYLLPKTVLPASSSVYQRLGRIYRRLVAYRLGHYAASVLTVSNRSADDISHYLGIARDRITVTYEAAPQHCHVIGDSSLIEATARKVGLRENFVLALGGVDSRKNTHGVLSAYCEFRRRSPFPCQLAVVGLPEAAARRFSCVARDLGVERDVVFTGFLSEQDLACLYNAALMFLYPSRYEGFGLPVLEAMSCGTPVIASTAGAVPEVAGDAAILVDPDDTHAIAESMVRLSGDQKLRATLADRGLNRARRFSWERCARETLAAYERTCSYGYSVRCLPSALPSNPG